MIIHQREPLLKCGSCFIKILSSILQSLLKRVHFSFENYVKWRGWWIFVSIVPGLQLRFNVSSKFCLNLQNRRWLNSSLSFVINLKPLGLWWWKVPFAEGLISANICFLKSVKHLNSKRHDFEFKVNLSHKQPSEVFCKKGVFINFTKFTGKHMCQSFFF